MSFNIDFDLLKEKANSAKGKAATAAVAAKKKAEELAAIAKANVAIYAEEDKIKKAQTELGKLYYNDHVAGEEVNAAAYEPWCEKISASRQTIENLRAQIAGLKDEEVTDEDFEVIIPEEPEEAPKEPEQPEEPKAE